ncbi:secreted RxLR effector protein 161-like [Impatiens glandulifera]|uniref:secreted RxLR effector protein 161-like n=1 Tax=Impatiens glandulifera TaxID=253017 RepID=UPI001FB12DC6|nr:secreted RxLR effector protein 161-like [Impatiens glandulifera]
MEKLGKQHWKAIKLISMYLKGTSSYGIVFRGQRINAIVARYVDSDYVSDMDDIRSTIVFVFTLCGGPICCKSTHQFTVALSTSEEKYMAVAETVKEALWLNGLVKDLGIEEGKVQLLCESKNFISLENNKV